MYIRAYLRFTRGDSYSMKLLLHIMDIDLKGCEPDKKEGRAILDAGVGSEPTAFFQFGPCSPWGLIDETLQVGWEFGVLLVDLLFDVQDCCLLWD